MSLEVIVYVPVSTRPAVAGSGSSPGPSAAPSLEEKTIKVTIPADSKAPVYDLKRSVSKALGTRDCVHARVCV